MVILILKGCQYLILKMIYMMEIFKKMNKNFQGFYYSLN